MLIYGISNRLDKEHSLFFYEFDNKQLSDVIDETHRLSRENNIDIVLLESSKNSYHLVSFDVMTKFEIIKICHSVRIESDLVEIDMQKLWGNPYEDNCLRLGKKFNKGTPKFLAWFRTPENDRYKSINHLLAYGAFCKVPLIPIPEFLKLPYKVYFVAYTTGVHRKKWIGGCKRKEYTRL
jgi:hypothetical protein